MKQLDGKITISKVSSNLNDDYINIELKDKNSGNRVIQIAMSPENFGLAVTGLSAIPVDVTLYGNFDTLGKKREVKSVKIPLGIDYLGKVFILDMQEKVKEFEVDGWKWREEDFNSRNVKDGYYNCTFIRFVEEAE